VSSRIAVDVKPRCHACRKLLAEAVTRPWTIRCGRCKATVTEATQHPIGKTTVTVEDDATMLPLG
jgi:phage FluMu protein Com